MIVKLKESHGRAFGFKVTETLTADDIRDVSKQIDFTIAANKKPIGIVADLSEMHGATWAARWEEMRFLQRHTDHIARLAIVSNDKWEEIAEMTGSGRGRAPGFDPLLPLLRDPACLALGENGSRRRSHAGSHHVSREGPVSGLHARVHDLIVFGTKT